MRTVCIIDIENKQGDYAECLQFIKTIEIEKSCIEKIKGIERASSKLSVQIGNMYTNFSPVYMEMPIELSERGQGVKAYIQERHYITSKDEQSILDYKEDIKYHIRIHFGRNTFNDCSQEIINLQYLAMLLKYVDKILPENMELRRKVTVFLVPMTGDSFPFEDRQGRVDYKTYVLASQYLRLLSKNYTGVIYGVKEGINGAKVTSLNFRQSRQKNFFFPLLLIDRNRYNLMFVETINGYLQELFELRANDRFRNADSESPNAAMGDYVVETCIKHIRRVIELGSRKWATEKNIIYDFLRKRGNINLMQFSLFAFMISEQESKEACDTYSYENVWEIAHELSRGLRQIVQNALQHTQTKECFFSFYLHIRSQKEERGMFQKRLETRFPEVVFGLDGRDEALEIAVSDINELEDMLDNFVANLQYEILEHKRVQGTSEKLLGHEEIVRNKQNIALRNFFAEYKENDSIQSWRLFRREDLIAHVGLAQFAQTARRCGAAVKTVSSKSSIVENENHFFYKSYALDNSEDRSHELWSEAESIIPGTQFSILVPIGKLKTEYQMGIGQLRQRKHVAENYEGFANFLEYQEQRKEILLKGNLKAGTREENNILNAKHKYTLVQQWTQYWKAKFATQIEEQNERKNQGKFYKYVFNYDFSRVVSLAYFADYDRIEVCLKGMIGALETIQQSGLEFYLAMTNLPEGFIDVFQRICILLSVKEFPNTLQLCLQEKCITGNSLKRIIMLGNDFSQAIFNSYVLSLEHGVKGFERHDCQQANELRAYLTKDEDVFEDNGQNSDLTGAMPFDVILSCESDNPASYFEKQLGQMVEGELNEEIVGYKLNNTHMRLGSKVHIESFYEMSFLFYRTTIANRLSFLILRKLLGEDDVDLLRDPVLFYGYASYSKAILTSITEILRQYRMISNAKTDQYVAFASFQHNLMLESEETQMYFGLQTNNKLGHVDANNCLTLNVKTKIIQVVPISSTLTTFDKMWKKFEESLSVDTHEKISLLANYTVFWVVDSNGNLEKGQPSSIEQNYWTEVKEEKILTKLTELTMAGNPVVEFFMRSPVRWNDPLGCELCYPKHVVDEVPLVETDPTSTVPAQQIRYKNLGSNKSAKISKDFCVRFQNLRDCVFYDHICRRQNHYQMYIDTQKYFYNVKNSVREWLEDLGKNSEQVEEDPVMHIIFSPEHNTNVGFAQYVNIYYFKGLAEIVSINVDKQFRSNFVCEHAALKQVIDELCMNARRKKSLPIKFYFVDDTITTGETFIKANGLLRSLVSNNISTTNLFDKVFVLVDRLSDDTKQMYVNDINQNFLSFLHIDVSNTRTHGDSCIGCKLVQDATKMFKRSATRNMAYYWARKAGKYQKKEYDNREKMMKINRERSYNMMVFSHVMQNVLVKQGRYSVTGEIYDAILNVSCWLLDYENGKSGHVYGFEPLLDPHRNIEGFKSLCKTISRPFFTYDFSVKRQMFTFFIILAELFMNVDEKEILPEEVKNKGRITFIFEEGRDRIERTKQLARLIQKNLERDGESFLLFFSRYILESLTDMGSTYVLRKQTIKKVYDYTNCSSKEYTEDEKRELWEAYEANVHRLVSNSADETRELWMEYLYMTGMEYLEFKEDVETCNKEKYEPRFLYTEIAGEQEMTENNKCFYQFCHNLFLQNTGINFDNLEELTTSAKKREKKEGKFFKDYWRQMYCLSQFKNPFCADTEEIHDIEHEKVLFSFLQSKDDKENRSMVNSVNEWYQKLLEYIACVICDKYEVRELDIALLTKTMNQDAGNTEIQSIDIVEDKICSRTNKLSETRYCIKNRIAQALSHKQLFELENSGYFLDEDLGETGVGRPYLIAFFDNPKGEMSSKEAGFEQNFVRVFLYISFAKLENKEKIMFVLRLILREVMTYRNRILRCLEKDFAGDLYARYARKNGEQNILSHEKAHSHNTTGDDRITLEVFQDEQMFQENYSQLDINAAKDWLLLRNYTNNQIAKIFNRSFQDIHVNKNRGSDSPELYPSVVGNSKRGSFKCALECFSQLNLKGKNQDAEDSRFGLLNQVINIEYDENLENACFIQGKKGEYYNLEYFRCILIDMLMSAIKYESTRSDFLLRIDRLLDIKDAQNKKRRAEYEWVEQNEDLKKLYASFENEECRVNIFRRESKHEGIDYLVIRNPINTCIHKMTHWERKNEAIKHRLDDPLDFADGHMSLLAIKRYVEQLNDKIDVECIFQYICVETNEKKQYYFENCLPVLRREDLS